jgi:hypothetical protein
MRIPRSRVDDWQDAHRSSSASIAIPVSSARSASAVPDGWAAVWLPEQPVAVLALLRGPALTVLVELGERAGPAMALDELQVWMAAVLAEQGLPVEP